MSANGPIKRSKKRVRILIEKVNRTVIQARVLKWLKKLSDLEFRGQKMAKTFKKVPKLGFKWALNSVGQLVL